jgi:Second Messenger Oligonucleotide or Dinucleotide Synthetase domain
MLVLHTTDSMLRKSQLVGILETICQQLELSDTQHEDAESRYKAVGTWLSSSDNALLHDAEIYPQGSFSIRTTVKPISKEEYDLDLVCLVPKFSSRTQPSQLKRLIGDRLRANEKYWDMIEEKPRCWRITYANEFHLDITPSIYNPTCGQGGELVPDKKINQWKPSNPRGYRRWFEERAKLRPRFLLLESPLAKSQIEALPGPTTFKGFLPRMVQLCKRHRDIWFSNRDSDLAPISIILTTLIANSYAYCVANLTYETEFDLLLEVLRHTENFIETDATGRFYVWNDTTTNENFAEKWNEDTRYADGFFSWHKQALTDFENLPFVSGLDEVKKSLSPVFGDNIVMKALSAHTSSISAHREKGTLAVGTGLGLANLRPRVVPIRSNTFFGN